MSATYRAIIGSLRMGQSVDLATMTAGGRCDIGDAMQAGLEAVDTLNALEPEIMWEAEELELITEGDTPSLTLAWERLLEHWADVQHKADEAVEELFAIRSALLETGSLSPDDVTTPLAGLITALFSA